MKRPRLVFSLYALLGVLYLLHNDIWFWNDSSLMLGLPMGRQNLEV